MLLSSGTINSIIRNLFKGDTNRCAEISAIHEAQFPQAAIDAFYSVVRSKVAKKTITAEQIIREVLNFDLCSNAIAVNSYLELKPFGKNHRALARNSADSALIENIKNLHKLIQEFPQVEDFGSNVNIKINSVSVDLTLRESLLTLYALAIARAVQRGFLWETLEKQLEKPLMIVLCRLFGVPPQYYDQTNRPATWREIDFYLRDNRLVFQPCEVKLMGRGNSESVGNALVRIREAKDSGQQFIFVADTLSQKNRTDLNGSKALWVELNAPNGFLKFREALKKLEIPHRPFRGDVSKEVNKILAAISDEAIERMAVEAVDPFSESAAEESE